MTMEDEMTEYPETECEADDGPQPMGGLFSGKGAAKAQKMFLARKARMAKYSSVSYGENTEHPDLEHLNKSDEESSDEDEDENQQAILNHDGHIEAYEVENLERIRKKKCAKVEHKLETTGKGMNLFQKRQQHVQKYIVDQPNENYDKDANHGHLQNGNSVNGVSETNGNYSPSPMFSVNLKHVAGNNKSSDGAENGHQNGEASFNIQLRQTGQLESLTRERESTAESSQNENELKYATNGLNSASKRHQLNQQIDEEDRQSVNSQMSNESALSTTSLLSTTNTFARGWARTENSHARQNSSTFKSVRAPQGKITSISCSSSIKIGNGGSKPYPLWNAKNTPSPRNSLSDVASFQQNSNFQKPSSHSAASFQPQAPVFRSKPATSQSTFSPATSVTPTPLNSHQKSELFSSNKTRPAASSERTRSSSWAPTSQKISSNGFTKKAPPPPPTGKPAMSPLLSRRLAASPAPSIPEQAFNFSPRNSCSSNTPETFKSSFSDLQIGSPMTQRKLNNPPAKQEIELRSPLPKVASFSLEWDQNSNNFQNEPEPESNSINIEEVSCQSEFRQPDIVVDFDMKSPVPTYLNGNSCHTPTVEDEQFQEDTASVTSFNSEVFEQQQAMEGFASAPAAPAPPAEAPAPPRPEPVDQSNQMTPTANLMASAFKMSAVPKLRKVAEPQVKWGGQQPVSQDRVHNSVKEEQNRVFQDQQRQRMEQQKREMEDKRVREEASRVQQVSAVPHSAQFAPLKNAAAQHSRRVHFSEAEGLRQQQGPLSYNKAATGFRANSLPETPAAPVSRPVTLPQTNRSAAPRPKFMAKSSNSTPTESWSSHSIGNGAIPQNAAVEMDKPATPAQKPQPSRWQPSVKPSLPPVQIPDYPSGNSIVMDNLDATYNSPPLPQSAHRRVNLSPPQKTPPPTPTKPIWYPGMRADPMQFSGRKMQYKTGPPPPAPKVGVASSDILAGPSRLVDKFELNKPAKQEFVPDASRLKLFQDLIDHHDNNRPRGGSGSRPGSRNGFTSLRDGYESDSGLAYRSKTANFSQFNNGPAKAQEAPATFVFDPMQSRGRGAKMFERQKNRMGKFTRDHREDYEQFKGQQTKNESFQHQVPVLPALSSVPPKPSLARPQRKNKEIGDFNRIMNRSGNRAAPNVWSPSGAHDF